MHSYNFKVSVNTNYTLTLIVQQHSAMRDLKAPIILGEVGHVCSTMVPIDSLKLVSYKSSSVANRITLTVW